MPDISMCLNDDCSKRDKCYCFKAKKDPYLYYLYFKEEDSKNCFMELRNNKGGINGG